MAGNPSIPGSYRRIAVLGTDTGVGKTEVTLALVQGLRALGRRVWVHKPVACGDWDGCSAEDGRRLRVVLGDGQPEATLCPLQFPEAASPHVAAAAADVSVSLAELRSGLHRVLGPHDLVVEGVGGLLVPLTTERETIVDLIQDADMGVLIVARPDLGTLNHTALTVAVARQRGLRLVGVVINCARPVADSLAVRSVRGEVQAITGLPVMAWVDHGSDRDYGRGLAQQVLAGC